MNLETIYNHAPIWVQNVMCSAKGWQIQKRRYGNGFFKELDLLKRHAINPDEELSKFLKAIEHVPAYRNVFNAKVPGKGKVSIKDFPIINKAIVKAHLDDYLNPDFHGPMFLNHTSGTTGSGIVFPNSVAYENRQWATWWRYRNNLGIKFGTWCGWFSCAHMVVPINETKPPYWRINWPGRQVMFSSYHLNASNVASYFDEINRRGLTWIHGYASVIRFLCRLALEKGLPPATNVKFLTTGAENLLPAYIEDMRKVFPNALIRTHYGQTEGVANFSQTPTGDWEIDEDFAYVEFIPVDPGTPSRCRIVGTSFSNLAFPLVRYDIGDIATVEWSNGKAKVLNIEGRENEYFVMKDGTTINTLRVYDIFKEAGNVVESQIRILGDDHVELAIVRGARYSANDEKEIIALARKYFTIATRVDISYVDKIERAASGKFKAVVRVD